MPPPPPPPGYATTTTTFPSSMMLPTPTTVFPPFGSATPTSVIPNALQADNQHNDGPMIYINQDSAIPGQNFRLLTTARSKPMPNTQAAAYASQFGAGGQQQQQQQQQQQYELYSPQQDPNQFNFDHQQQQQDGGFDQQQHEYQQQLQPQSGGGGYDQRQPQQDQRQQQQLYQQEQMYEQQQQYNHSQYDIPPENPRQSSQPHLSREEKDKKARVVFKKYDKDGNGFLDMYEFLQAMNHLGANLSYADAQGIFQAFDENNQNSINIDQFAANFCANY
jgi:hypothetical protein